jgi:hypothetical protein
MRSALPQLRLIQQDKFLMPYDPAALRLGRMPARADGRSLRFARYLTPALPAPPAAVDYGGKVAAWGMLANDRLGDCTCAGILHMIMLWASQYGTAPAFGDADAVALYERLCGYRPGQPGTDRGGVELDILKAWRKAPIQGRELLAFAAVDPTDWKEVKLAHWLAGTLYMGVNLPLSAQREKVWSGTRDAPGGWGGHCMVTSAYRDAKSLFGLKSSRRLTAVTWGTTQEMTPEWVAAYCDELWVPVTPAWFGPNGVAPNGFNLEQLKADVAAISHFNL